MATANPPNRRPLSDLTGKQRRYLRSLAHHVDPLIQVGKEGLSDALLSAVAKTLADHELVKVRVLEASPLDRHEIAAPLAAALGAHVVGTVGRIVLLYRMRVEQPGIQLPARSASELSAANRTAS
jgi:RNA-binding protein